MNIIPTKAAFPSWWVAGMALILLGLGVPLLTGRLLLIPGDDVRQDLMAGRPVQSADLESFETSRLRAAGWFPASSVPGDLAMASIERAMRAAPKHRELLLKDADYWQRRALSITPADAFGWFRLAYLAVALDGPSARAAQAWSLSYAAAPYEPRLLSSRAQMGVKLGSFLGVDEQRRLPDMIRAAWQVDGMNLLHSAVQDADFRRAAEAALAQDPEDLAAFRSELARAN